MTIVDQTPERLVVEAGDVGFARVLLGLSVACVLVAGVLVIREPDSFGSRGFNGTVTAALIFLAGFLVVYEQGRFTFDRRTGILTWYRRRAFSLKSGVIRFDEIETVVPETNGAEKAGSVPKWRVVLKLPKGDLPISVSYAPHVEGAPIIVAETIRRFTGRPVKDPFMGRLRAAVYRGDLIEASRLLREEKRMGATSAERILEDLTAAARRGE